MVNRGLLAKLTIIMFWTDRGPKFLVILMICSLVVYMTSTLFPGSNEAPSTPSEQAINQRSLKGNSRNLWYDTVMEQLNTDKYKQLQPLMQEFPKEYHEWDPQLIAQIKSKYLIPPSNQSYNLDSDPDVDTSMGQAEVVRQVLGDQRDGFFIECGALDGETRSNTLIFERQLGWSGVLIEADPVNLMQCLDKHRRAWIVPACLSTQKKTMYVNYRAWGNIGHIIDHKALPKDNLSKQDPNKVVRVTCIPFASILLALNRTTVDYLSLDVEGNELDILKTIPFDEIHIKVISAEFFHAEDGGSNGGEMVEFMEQKGYYVHANVTHPQNLANDYIFVKRQA